MHALTMFRFLRYSVEAGGYVKRGHVLFTVPVQLLSSWESGEGVFYEAWFLIFPGTHPGVKASCGVR